MPAKNYSAYKIPAPIQALDPFSGVLLIDKPSGITSHDVVYKIRRNFEIKKVGHAGTLDPAATGLLTILLGKGTKLSNSLMSCDKTYEGTMRLGISTDSQDADGEIIQESDPSSITSPQLEAEIKALTGDMYQTPPMVSAIKVNGVPLYKKARKGETVHREPRFIHIYEFALKKFYNPEADFLVRCTKGTYVRTLCADIGEKLGCGAHLSKLRRTNCGDLNLEDAFKLDDILALSKTQLLEKIIPLKEFIIK